ncbi:MAG: 8-oxo-dGTP diphosphatase MutT [Pseudomonadota bacterium]|nr:8-oxo-dGTP diphosphatase MutT [Pseudomonadota bacterium]
MTHLPIVLVAAVALLDRDGRVLISQRPQLKSMAGLWEFPGGKIEDGETPEEALIRELREELSVETVESCLAPFTFASHEYETFHLLMPLYVCRKWNGHITPMEKQQIRWVMPNQLNQYSMLPADKPLVAMLRDYL